MTRVTAKLRAAVEVLGLEEYGDCSTEDVLSAVERHRVRPESIYRLMQRLGYRWTGRGWMRIRMPVWLREVERGETGDVI